MTTFRKTRITKAIETVNDAAARVLLVDSYDDQDLVTLENALWLLLEEVRKK